MSVLRSIEKTLDRRLRSLFGGGREEPGAREAVELYRDALEQIASRGVAGKAGRVFPFNIVTIELRAENPERKAVLETIFDPKQTVDDIRATLEEDRMRPPEDLAVMIHFPENAASDLRVICEKTEAPAAVPAAVLVRPLKPANLTMLEGASAGWVFALDRSPIHIGREREIVDSQGRLVRRNELFFPESDHEMNGTVSRAHAHIAFETASGDWRIYDDGSSVGTAIFRQGRRIDVPPHASRGVALRTGDEIYLGQVRIRFDG
jgi:hypothetical protein